jgi:hypothetical protein
VNQGGAASGQAWQFMGGGPPLIPLAAETVKAKKLEEKKKCIAICRSCSLPFLLHPHLVTRGSVLFSFDLFIHSRYIVLISILHKMSAVQPVAVYALRVPPGAMVAAVPNAAASVSLDEKR